MTLPTPNLDDRTFQDLVDDAKRHVQRHCPEWTDHNVSDPGVTLIETVAMMVDQLLYRLNRVPDRLYVRFLDLIGVRLFPPAAAEVDVTFWLTAPQPEPVVVKAGAEVLTQRTEVEDPVVFTTSADLTIVPVRLSRLANAAAGGEPVDCADRAGGTTAFPCFAATPAVGDVLLLGLDRPAPSCAVALRFDCEVAGVGVDPRQAPLVWEAWTGSGWEACDLQRDETGGLNESGDVVVHVPPGHVASRLAGHSAAWLRCRVVTPRKDQPFYTASPRIRDVTAYTVGGTVPAMHGEAVRDEVAGISEGVPGQRFRLAGRPVADTGEDVVVVTGDGEEWTRVDHFAESGKDDRHFVLDPVAGEIQLGPAVRRPDGTVRQYGAVPGQGTYVRVREYRTGGGWRGNVAAGAIRSMRTSVPFVQSRVTNRRDATGGADGEDVENAKLRGPMVLRTRHRAVTAEDFEHLAHAAARQVARVRCVPTDPAEPSVVRVLIVPDAGTEPRIELEDLKPADELLATVSSYLDARRLVGTRLVVEPPFYQGVTVVTRLRARPRTDPAALRERALDELYRYLHPITGGPDGTGWPFGRPVQSGEIFAILQRLPGVDVVEEIRLYPADLRTGERSEEVSRVDVDRNALVLSYEHHVLTAAP